MGLIKRIWNTATKDWKNANYQLKAVLKQNSIEKGEKILPPKHPTDAIHFDKAIHDPELRKKVESKDDELIGNVNKINIKSIDPPERRISDKSFPTRESEWLHRNDAPWEYGFYEPSLEKMRKNRIMFREALEILRHRIEFESLGPNGERRKFAEEALKKYNEHPSIARIDKEKLENVWKYFRPFERNEQQRVVKTSDLKELEDFIEGRSASFVPEITEIKLALNEQKDDTHRSVFAKKLLQMNNDERKEFLEAIQSKRDKERKRLEERLQEMKLLETEMNETSEKEEKVKSDEKKKTDRKDH